MLIKLLRVNIFENGQILIYIKTSNIYIIVFFNKKFYKYTFSYFI